MPKYQIHYYFDGSGQVDIEAKDEAEAKLKWEEGDYKEEDEWGETYTIDHINKI